MDSCIFSCLPWYCKFSFGWSLGSGILLILLVGIPIIIWFKEKSDGYWKDIVISVTSMVVAGFIYRHYLDCDSLNSKEPDNQLIRTAITLALACLGVGASLLSIRRTQRMDRQIKASRKQIKISQQQVKESQEANYLSTIGMTSGMLHSANLSQAISDVEALHGLAEVSDKVNKILKIFLDYLKYKIPAGREEDGKWTWFSLKPDIKKIKSAILEKIAIAENNIYYPYNPKEEASHSIELEYGRCRSSPCTI
ncbi:MAG: hypothetical protein OXB93_01865 [Cytophagales bacterium]|nr:hypothetical protein [Cytophagales bacterium]